MTERQALNYHKLVPITLIALLACLSISTSYGQVSNPSTGDTIKAYCSTGICSTGPVKIINHTKVIAPIATPIGSVTLSQYCIGNSCITPTTVTQQGKIGIQLTQACLAQLKATGNSSCGVYNPLKQFDNTNPLWSGLWVEQPYEHRLNPKVKNHENFNPNPWVVMVDPNADYTTGAKMIYVSGGNLTWTDQNDSSISGFAMKVHVGRYVSPDCMQATVESNLSIIDDTIKYLESGCSVTNFNDTKIINQKEIPFSYNNPYSTLHYQTQVTKIKATGGLGDCIRHQCSYTDPYKKSGW